MYANNNNNNYYKMTIYEADVQTAIAIIPYGNIIQEIEEIRQEHDPAYNRWMPHINLMFGFVSEKYFQDIVPCLQKAFDNIEPFDIEFKKLNYFSHGKTQVVYAEPELSLSAKLNLQVVYQTIATQFPNLVTKEFVPHLTLAKAKTNVKELHANLSYGWTPCKFTVKTIDLISRRGPDDRFQIRHSLSLKN